MIFFFGQRLYGKCDAAGGVFVTTRFNHLQLLPLVPRCSFLVAVGANPDRVLQIPLVGRSVLAAYARIWAPVAAFVATALTAEGSALVGVPLGIAALSLTLFGWLRLGRLTKDELALRAAYARCAGAPADVALVARATRGPDAGEARAWLGEITRRAEETIYAEGVDLAASYRGLARHTRWQEVAARAHAATPACQAAALTLARIATETAPPAERADTARAHDEIWRALRSAETGRPAELPTHAT